MYTFTLSDEQKQPLIDTLISEWESMKLSFTREELEDCGKSGIDVRLQLRDNELSLHTGDIQYDTNHIGAWGYATLEYDWEEDELHTNITELVTDLISQVKEAMSMSC